MMFSPPRARASLSSSSEKSKALTCAPSAASRREYNPLPQAISRICWPAWTFSMGWMAGHCRMLTKLLPSSPIRASHVSALASQAARVSALSEFSSVISILFRRGLSPRPSNGNENTDVGIPSSVLVFFVPGLHQQPQRLFEISRQRLHELGRLGAVADAVVDRDGGLHTTAHF